MPQYTIQRDPPWVQQPTRGSLAPSASVYSEEDDYQSQLDLSDMPAIPPLRLQKSYHPSYHAHPEQQISDHGPQVRQSRLPIFKQVRSILNKPTHGQEPASSNTNPYSTTGHLPAAKRPIRKSSIKTLKTAFDGKNRSPERRVLQKKSSQKTMSPVSVHLDENWEQSVPPSSHGWDAATLHEVPEDGSPVSYYPRHHQQRQEEGFGSQISVNACSNPETPVSTSKTIKRKPAPSVLSLHSENVPPTSMHSPPDSPPPSRDTNNSVTEIEGRQQHQSHFSWSTHAPSAYAPSTAGRQQQSHFSWTTCAPSGYAPSTATRPSLDYGGRPSMDVSSPSHSRQQSREEGGRHPKSHFSWSTVGTGITNQMRPDSPPPSPPPPVPAKWKAPPVQSILSRQRPIQRLDREQYSPPPRNASLSYDASSSNTPTSTKSKLTLTTNTRNEDTPSSAKKQLPPPPDMVSPVTPMTRLESLLREEQDKIHQRRNIEHVIAELSKIENASPMDVPFAQVRDAKKRLVELRSTLAEIQLEERDIGIAIARARRKEGEEEGLWVRRVTG